jgi:hypothetical protein
MKDGLAKSNGLIASIEPQTGRVIWLTTRFYVTAGCTISAENGRLYLGGYNPPNDKTNNRYMYCLDAKNGSLIWQSEPVAKAVNVVTIGKEFVFVHASAGKPSYLIDKDTGKILSMFDKEYACTRFTLPEPYIIGPNMDMIDTSQDNLIASSVHAWTFGNVLVELSQTAESSTPRRAAACNSACYMVTKQIHLPPCGLCSDNKRSIAALAGETRLDSRLWR